MPPEASLSEADRAAAATMADLLEQGRAIHLLSVALCAGALVVLLLAPGWRYTIVPGAILLVGLAETWMALRVGFDACCFRRITGTADGAGLADFDRLMDRLGLMPQDKAGRSMAPRITGAKRLLALQGAALVLQVGLALLVGLAG